MELEVLSFLLWALVKTNTLKQVQLSKEVNKLDADMFVCVCVCVCVYVCGTTLKPGSLLYVHKTQDAGKHNKPGKPQ